MNKKIKYILIALVVYILLGLVYLGVNSKIVAEPSKSEAESDSDLEPAASQDNEIPGFFEPISFIIQGPEHWMNVIFGRKTSDGGSGGGGDVPIRRY